MKMKKAAAICMAALIAVGGVMPMMDSTSVYASEEGTPYSWITGSVTAHKTGSSGVHYVVTVDMTTPASSCGATISLQKKVNGEWKNKETIFESDVNTDSFLVSGVFDTSWHGKGTYRVYATGSDTTNGITTKWKQMTSDSVAI